MGVSLVLPVGVPIGLVSTKLQLIRTQGTEQGTDLLYFPVYLLIQPNKEKG